MKPPKVVTATLVGLAAFMAWASFQRVPAPVTHRDPIQGQPVYAADGRQLGYVVAGAVAPDGSPALMVAAEGL